MRPKWAPSSTRCRSWSRFTWVRPAGVSNFDLTFSATIWKWAWWLSKLHATSGGFPLWWLLWSLVPSGNVLPLQLIAFFCNNRWDGLSISASPCADRLRGYEDVLTRGLDKTLQTNKKRQNAASLPVRSRTVFGFPADTSAVRHWTTASWKRFCLLHTSSVRMGNIKNRNQTWTWTHGCSEQYLTTSLCFTLLGRWMFVLCVFMSKCCWF